MRKDNVSEKEKELKCALEINLISTHNLKPLIWADPDHKVKTQIYRVGGENPSWNNKFFKIRPESSPARPPPSASRSTLSVASVTISLDMSGSNC
jgi:hypothetical protein|uniref:C2 domain-containing protein n=1 Tax=Fagus sylvatica TaxID=28930 RepID=A0A2N9F9N8_FAGSY